MSLKLYLPTKKSRDADKKMASIWMTRPQPVIVAEVRGNVNTAASPSSKICGDTLPNDPW